MQRRERAAGPKPCGRVPWESPAAFPGGVLRQVAIAVFLIAMLLTSPARADEPRAEGPLESKYREFQRSAYAGTGQTLRPGLALALSLTPAPIDIGNLYVGNAGWGATYTGAELTLAGGGVWLLASHRCSPASACHHWQRTDTRWGLGLLGLYSLLKLAAGLHARRVAITSKSVPSRRPRLSERAFGVRWAW